MSDRRITSHHQSQLLFRNEKMLNKKWFHLSSAEELIFYIGIVTALALLRSRYDYIDGNPVPVLIFSDKPSLFHGFLIALNFSFTAAVAAMTLRDKTPKLARFCRRTAVACIVVAAGLLSYSASLPSSSFSSSSSRSPQ